MVYMYHSFLIHSSADGHLACFHVLAMINSAAMNTGVHVSLSDLASHAEVLWQWHLELTRTGSKELVVTSWECVKLADSKSVAWYGQWRKYSQGGNRPLPLTRLSPTLRCPWDLDQHSPSRVQLCFPLARALSETLWGVPRRFTYRGRRGAEWVSDADWALQLLIVSAKRPKPGGGTAVLPPLYGAQGPRGPGSRRDGFSRPVIWEDLTSELSRDCQAQHTVSPCGSVSPSTWPGFEMEPPESPGGNPECMMQEQQIVAAWPLWPHLTGHLASLLPSFVTGTLASLLKFERRGRRHTLPLKGDMSTSFGAVFSNGHTDI